ncbi:gamma-glutamyl-gamma-aminobutyrate hydrolase family protein [Litoricola sp.]|nr:gamma-glutamyl-gamma-aminobutyrate hydrolase family protein [Litorivicinus sp.]
MKYVGITLRVSENAEYIERRDCIDQRWIELVLGIGFIPILIPNNITYVDDMFSQFEFDSFILTGGNDLVKYNGNSPERDMVEKSILMYCVKRRIPLLGVCRGMQVVQDFYGISLERVPSHVAVSHPLEIIYETRFPAYFKNISNVNSFHKLGTYSTKDPLKVVARAPDGLVEAVEHNSLPILGQMWHPERENPVDIEQARFLKKFLGNI